ncbi:MAG: CDP-alcohol phosphatidyltransferase family protein [Microthrixaceae bacterium]|nr:CDP-alcohol phosphatidyltransferase family protein [Microthrixaceae bacterium]
MPELFEHPEGTSTGEFEIDRILTVPNLITSSRALCIPLFVYLLFARDSRGWAGVLLGTLGATDWVDGHVARRFNQTSTFGKMFDPSVDRLLMVVAILSIVVDGSAPLWFSLTIVSREVLVSIWVIITLALSGKRMNVTWWGKVGTFANLCAFPWFLFSAERSWSPEVRDLWELLAYAAAIPGVVFSLLAGWQYLRLGVEAIGESREDRVGTG